MAFIKTYPYARVSWSINTLDEAFRSDMDCAVSALTDIGYKGYACIEVEDRSFEESTEE